VDEVLESLKDSYNKCLKYLVRREYSQFELQQKLSLEGFDSDIISETLERLKNEKLQSDERFSEMFIRTRVNQGKGDILIKQQLKQKGIEYVDLSDYDFYALTKEVQRKKYASLPTTAKEKAQQIRFLQSRGFSFDAINAIFT
jgi:regulatory protein